MDVDDDDNNEDEFEEVDVELLILIMLLSSSISSLIVLLFVLSWDKSSSDNDVLFSVRGGRLSSCIASGSSLSCCRCRFAKAAPMTCESVLCFMRLFPNCLAAALLSGYFLRLFVNSFSSIVLDSGVSSGVLIDDSCNEAIFCLARAKRSSPILS